MTDVGSVAHAWPGVPDGHGPLAFTSTRLGGVSAGSYASLNIGRSVGDDDTAVTENRSRLLADRRITAAQLALCHQTHSTGVAVVTAGGGALDVSFAAPRADALITSAAEVAVGVMVADCVPLLLWGRRAGVVAAVHAGRVGMYAGIIGATLAVFRDEFDISAAECHAVVGPSIGPCCYEVSSEIADAFRRRFGADVATARQLDLWTTAERCLADDGVAAPNMRVERTCTSCDPARFFSYRRDGAETGRMVSVVVAPSQARGCPS
ncbi:multicopper polyphenol oxidase [Candidatus Poribacteria bacterium]|nr:multicopper polyphenol oxidase [Candidatus Poribacteria bacterium]